MTTFSQFTTHFLSNLSHMPAHVSREIRREAAARLRAQFALPRAAGPLDFSDLVERIEHAVAPR